MTSKNYATKGYTVMMTHIISIKPDAVENPHSDLPFDVKRIFKSDIKRPIVPSASRIRQAITIDGKLAGYVHTVNFALELVREKFSQEIRRLYQEHQVKQFLVKYEQSEGRRVCKLYQLNPGLIYNSKSKLMTVQIDSMPRLEFDSKKDD